MKIVYFLADIGLFWVLFLLCAVLFYLMAQSKRLNAKLAPPDPEIDFTPVMPHLPDRKTYTKSLLQIKLDMITAAYQRRSVHGPAYQMAVERIAVFAAVRCWLDIFAGIVWVIFKDVQWLLRKCRCLPSAKTGMYINVVLLWLMSCYKPLYNFGTTKLDGLALYWSEAELQTNWDRLHLYLGLLSPLLFFGAIFLCFIFLKNRELYYDFFGIIFLLFIAVYKLLGCAVSQCCFGIPFAWGVYNDQLGTIVFPIQLLESAAAFLGVAIGAAYMLLAKSYRTGRAASILLLWYAATRFVAEFFRYHGDDYRPNSVRSIGGLSAMHWACLTGMVIAVVFWFLLPLEKKILDAVSIRGKAFFSVWRKRMESNATWRAFYGRVLANCPEQFRQYYGVELQ